MVGWILVLFLLCSPLTSAQEELPFWRKKSHLIQQIQKERRVVVSVRKDGPKKFRAAGVGMVNVPLKPCFLGILEFENLPKVSSYFKIVRHDPKKKNLYLKMEGFGYVAHMLLVYKVTQDSPLIKQLDWKVISGSFRGMVGHFKLLPQGGEKTEVSFWSHFTEPKFPLPSFFLTFTLEVIAEKVAQKMRTYLEAQNLKQKSRSSDGSNRRNL